MKKLLLFITTFASLTVSAQKNNSVRIYGGRTFFGSGDLKGFNLSTEYQRQLAKFFSVGAELSTSNAIKGKRFDITNITDLYEVSSNSAVKINLNTYFNVVNRPHHLAQIGLGLSGRSGHRAYTGALNLVRISDNVSQYFISRNVFEKRNELGYTISLGYEYRINTVWSIGVKASQQVYFTDSETNLIGGVAYSF
ncbi:MAG: hypothetical protein ACK4NY_19085 [Spirosomataceae bacterium]